MSKQAKQSLVVVVGVAIAMAMTMLLPLLANRRTDETREIVLVARNMTFYLEGDSTPNPAIRVRANERVRLVLRNEDPGMSHDVVIEGWDVAVPSLRGLGTTSVELRVPSRAGTQEYFCTPHAITMRGVIAIE